MESQGNKIRDQLSQTVGYYLLFILYYEQFKFKRFLYFSILVILFLLSLFIWGLQSRGSLICWFIVWLVFFIFDTKKFLYKVNILIILVLTPIFLFEYSINNQKEKVIKELTTDNNKSIITKKNRLLGNQHFKVDIRVLDEQTGEFKIEKRSDYTTGRIYIWQRALKAFLKKPLLGYGPQGDRIALMKDKTNISSTERHIWDNNASNGIVYIGLCAGILGVIVLISIYIVLLSYILKSLFSFKVFKYNDFFIKISVTLIIMFMVRSIYENSFTVFSIDFLVVLVSFNY